MKKQNIILTMSLLLVPAGMAYGQSAFGAYGAAQPDMKGTARYMGMAGAFGALGGDLSAITQNPGGIGVYRSSDIGFTLDLDLQTSTTQADGYKYKMDQTKFLLNNLGAVLTLRLPSKTMPNLNFGFVYNKGASFNRIYGGTVGLKNSMSNYIAYGSDYGYWDSKNHRKPYTPADLGTDYGYDPYLDGIAPWMNVLAYQANVINPQFDSNGNFVKWYGLWSDAMNNGTSGSGSYLMQEIGGTNDFNIIIGGNIADKLYWGMNFDIISLNYQLNTYWGESLENGYGQDYYGNPTVGPVNWDYNGSYRLSGTGFQYQLGLIFKPVQQLRIGFAFHTPTWYSLNEEFIGNMTCLGEGLQTNEWTNDGIPGYTNYNFRTPWKILASAAGVIGNNFIVSFDYEWANYGKMKFSEVSYYDDYYYDYPWDYPWDWYSASAPVSRSSSMFPNTLDPYYNENNDIAEYYRYSNTFRVGLEFKPIPSVSIRAGYANVSSPVSKEIKNNQIPAYTSSLSPSYRLDNSTNYITCGLGYRYNRFYVDLAYVWKRMDSEYHAWTPWMPSMLEYRDTPMYTSMLAPQSKVSLVNNQIVLSAGYRF